MALQQFPCIGGPLSGKLATFDEIGEEYTAYNCSYRCNRSKFAQRKAAEKGEIIPPSMIWIHKSCFEKK